MHRDPFIPESARQVIASHPEITAHLSLPVRAILLPVLGPTDQHFLLLDAYFLETSLGLEIMSQVFAKIIETISQADLLKGLAGIEILACVMQNGQARRVLRLAMPTSTLHLAKHLHASHLQTLSPFPRATCHLYMKELAAPE